MAGEKLHPRNRTARLAEARAAGNPVTTELESGVGNCFPGLEADIRNLDRRFFPYLTVDFLGGQGIEVAEASLDRAQAEESPGPLLDGIRRVATEPGPWRVTQLRGDFAGFGARTFPLNELGESDGVPPDAWTAVRLLRPATQVTLELQRAGAPRLTLTATRASYLSDDGAFAEMFEPGELTQSLCSPWTHDFRDCGCFYWASNHPDLTLPALPAGVANDDPDWGVRALWLRADRQGVEPPPAAPLAGSGEFRRPGVEMDYFEINQRWQDLDVVLDGRELRVPYDPTEVAGTPLPPEKLLPMLRYAAGVEVAVMVEYLAAVYSLNTGAGAPGSVLRDDVRAARQQLLLVAISEMRHLRWVNSVLFTLHRRAGAAGPFTPALGIATILKGSPGFPDRPVRFRALTPEVMAEFVRVEAPSLTVDGLYSSLLATFERDGDDELAGSIRSVMADGAEHFASFLAMQEWLSRHNPAQYLRPLQPAPAGDQGLGTLQQRYEQVLDSLFQGYRLGVPAGTSRINTARQTMLGPQGIDGACEALAQRGFLPAFTTADPRFAPRTATPVTLAVDTAVLGSGAVALAHALFQSRHGPVVLAGQLGAPAPAVERVPAPLLTLLLELGVIPAELDVDSLTRQRLVAWEDPEPTERVGPACAHVDRGALIDVLWRRVRACSDVHVVPPVWRRGEVTCRGAFEGPGWRATRLADATGRRALTAAGRMHASPAWVATCCTVLRGDADPTMCLAAGPGGYAYRLGSARWLTVGWVGPGAPPVDGAGVGERICREGAGWLSEDIDLGAAQIARRVASVTVTVGAGDAQVAAIGDAALGRDALASQGVAIGLSDARLAADPDGGTDTLGRRHHDGLERHLDHLAGMLATCGHREARAWVTYRRWLEEQRIATPTGVTPRRQRG